MGYPEKRWVVVVATAGWLSCSLACAVLALLFGSALPWSARIVFGLYACLGIAMALHHSRRARAEALVTALVGGALGHEPPDGLAQSKTRLWRPSQHSLRIDRGRRFSAASLVTVSKEPLRTSSEVLAVQGRTAAIDDASR
jgi:hypothetical protein